MNAKQHVSVLKTPLIDVVRVHGNRQITQNHRVSGVEHGTQLKPTNKDLSQFVSFGDAVPRASCRSLWVVCHLAEY